jgi:hypothetical protein
VLSKTNQTDFELIGALASSLSFNERARLLRAVANMVVAQFVRNQQPSLTDQELDDAISEQIHERLHNCRSDTNAAYLLSLAGMRDPDLNQALFPDGRAEAILVADEELRASGEDLLAKYLDYIANYPEYDLAHPSDHSGPREEDEDKEWERLVLDFANLVRHWRDDFIRALIHDCADTALRVSL